FEEEKKRSQMPLGVLREIIRHGGEAVAGFYQEKAGTIAGRVAQGLENVKTRTESIREELEQKVRGVTGIFRKGAEDSGTQVKDVLAAGEKAVEDLRTRVDTAVKQALETLGGPAAMASEIDRLQKRVVELEKKLEQL